MPKRSAASAKAKPSAKSRPKKKAAKSASPIRGAIKPPNTANPKSERPYKLPNAYQLSRQAGYILWEHKELFLGLTLVYGLLNLILVQGLASSSDVSSLKSQLDNALSGHLSSVFSGLGVFVVLVSSAGNGSSQTAGAYQVFLTIIASLAIIWSLRQVLMGRKIRIRDAYYQGMYPLVPLMLVLLVLVVQLLPLIIGSALYSIVISNGIAIGLLEKLVFAIIGLALASWTVYMLSASIFAVYIVTLPDMTPIKALKSAKQLVKQRRWSIIRKLLSLPVILIVVSGIIMLPIILVLTPLAQWIFFILTMFGLVALHTYLYALYRDLLA